MKKCKFKVGDKVIFNTKKYGIINTKKYEIINKVIFWDRVELKNSNVGIPSKWLLKLEETKEKE